MKCFRRCLSVLLCCVLLSVVFSVTANAETIKVSPYHVYAQSLICAKTSCNSTFALTFYPNNGTIETRSFLAPNTTAGSWTGAVITGNELYREINYTIATDDGSPLYKQGNETKVNISKIYNSIQIKEVTTNVVTTTPNVHEWSVYVTYTDNTTYSIPPNSITLKSNIDYEYSSLEFSHTPEKDVKSIYIVFKTNLKGYVENTGAKKYSVESFIGEYAGDNSHNVSVEQQSEEAGLLSGLIGWVQKVFNSVKDGFSALGEGITNVFDTLRVGFQNVTNQFNGVIQGILDLPAKLWTAIENGLKWLFVPDEYFMTEYSDTWDELLAQRFGAVYQAAGVIRDFWNALDEIEHTGTINMPVVSLEKIGIPFEFGGYEVNIVPSGFAKVQMASKLITTIVCSMLFINGLRKRYDEVMGVKE